MSVSLSLSLTRICEFAGTEGAFLQVTILCTGLGSQDLGVRSSWEVLLVESPVDLSEAVASPPAQSDIPLGV